MEGEVEQLRNEKDQCFNEFDEDIPAPVKNERKRRMQNVLGKKKKPVNTESDKPTDMYYQISVNCKYRKRIHDMLKDLRAINQKRRDLEEKYAPLKGDLTKVKEVKVYKAVKGDAIDELWCYHLNLHQIDLPVKRIAVGKYLFGQRQIMAKIINGKLVIRVGGGYMSAAEFIEQYGKIELMKMMKAQEEPDTGSQGGGNSNMRSGRGSVGRMSSTGAAMSMGEMKDYLRQSLNNVKTYEAGKSNT